MDYRIHKLIQHLFPFLYIANKTFSGYLLLYFCSLGRDYMIPFCPNEILTRQF